MKVLIVVIFTIVIVGIFVLVQLFDLNQGGPLSPPISSIDNFDECMAAGNPVMESYPRQCRTAEGELFVEKIDKNSDKSDLIQVDSPKLGATIESPIEVKGKARGYWFFEASFPVKVVDENGVLLGLGIAQAEGEWMTEEFVPFSVKIRFEVSTSTSGYLVLEKDNPSGDPTRDDELKIPIVFGRP